MTQAQLEAENKTLWKREYRMYVLIREKDKRISELWNEIILRMKTNSLL